MTEVQEFTELCLKAGPDKPTSLLKNNHLLIQLSARHHTPLKPPTKNKYEVRISAK
ncbi:MAG: hypothetical protein VYA84_07865 [Planctomycetota bacterium]|nr:hypothetical protein [Planctomycetota bacterium]